MMQDFHASEEAETEAAGTQRHTTIGPSRQLHFMTPLTPPPPVVDSFTGFGPDPVPPRRHKCWPATYNWHDTFDLVERCPCGGVRIGGRGRWWRRNSAAATGLRRRWLERGRRAGTSTP